MSGEGLRFNIFFVPLLLSHVVSASIPVKQYLGFWRVPYTIYKPDGLYGRREGGNIILSLDFTTPE